MSENRRILFVNATVWPESRTLKLARYYLKHISGKVEEIDLDGMELKPLNWERLQKRQADIDAGLLAGYDLAWKFREADEIVIAAPYWDYSVPAALKTFVELINVYGITFRYVNDEPEGLCKAERLVFISTAGGLVGNNDFGASYFRALAQTFWGITDIAVFQAEGLDMLGNDPEAIMNETIRKIDEYLKTA